LGRGIFTILLFSLLPKEKRLGDEGYIQGFVIALKIKKIWMFLRKV
jgi:hypothetical protein